MIIALIDNDVIQKLAEIKRDTQEAKEKVVLDVFQSLNIKGQMHELLHRYEFRDVNNAKLFFDHGVFSVLSLAEMFSEDTNKEIYYRILVPELFKKMTGQILEIEDVLNEWIHNKSLGEIHSLAACMICDYAMFVSDDNDSKYLNNIIKTDYQKIIKVYNRNELVRGLESGTVKKTDRNAFRHIH